jgi:hypothetical protein
MTAMPDLDSIREIVSRLPGSTEGGSERFSFGILSKGKAKGFVWTWAERVHPKKPKVINEGVVAISVPSLQVKEILLGRNVSYIFTEPHYDNYPAVLVRLSDIPYQELEDLLIEGWRTKAQPSQIQEYDAQSGT